MKKISTARKISPIGKAFAARLIELRERQQMTKLGLSKAAGVDRKFIYGIEALRQEPSLAVADKLARALGVPLSEMLPKE